MKSVRFAFVIACLSATAAAIGSSQDTPIDKVIILIKGLQTKIQKEGAAEQKTYDTYACWVEDTLARKATDISEAKALLGRLDDSIKQLKAAIASHGAEITQLNKDIAQNKEAMKEASGVRKKENAEYEGARSENEQCIGALEAATKVLTGAGTKAGFLQQLEEAQLMSVTMGVRKAVKRMQATMSDSDLQVVSNFVQHPQAFAAHGMSAAQVGQNPFGDYAPQSTQIQGILKGMYDSFTSDLEKDNAEEAKSQKSFEDLMATKKQEFATMQATLQKQETDSAAKTKQLAEDSVLRDDTTEQLAADEKLFEEVKSAAEDKATEWSVRTRLRTEELAGMEGAVQILAGGSKTFKEATTTFVQLKSVKKHENRHEAYHKLKSLAAKYQSASLAKVVSEMKSEGHFDKVFIMIDHMMKLLREEEQEDIKHRDRCEVGENANKNDMEDANSEIQKTEKSLKRMENTDKEQEQEISNIEGEIKETKKNMAEMLKLRNKDHADFVRALQADAEAVSLIEAAVARLAKYYKEHNIPLEFVQSPEYSKDPNAPPEASFSGADSNSESSTGIVAILEMIKEDLVKEMKEGKADEAKAQAEYVKQSGALQDSLDAQKETKVSLEKENAALQERMANFDKYKKDKEADLDSEKDMKKSLKTDCAWVTTHFEKRRTARKKEMDGLVEAKSFLAGVESGDAVLAP